MTTPDPAALAAWNAANEHAKAAYDEAPASYSELLANICARCDRGQHYTCTRALVRGSGLVRCICSTHRHPSRTWWG